MQITVYFSKQMDPAMDYTVKGLQTTSIWRVKCVLDRGCILIAANASNNASWECTDNTGGTFQSHASFDRGDLEGVGYILRDAATISTLSPNSLFTFIAYSNHGN